MSSQDLALLLDHARRVRAAIETMPRRPTHSLRNFPRGACGDASLLLGAYLADRRITGFSYICGERGSKREDNWTSHAWLQRGSCIVDITADQFDDAPAPIIVADPSPWHETFTIERRPDASDFRVYSGPGMLYVMYADMLQHLPAAR